MQPRFPRDPLRPLAIAALLAALAPLHPLQAADSPAAARLETPALPAPPDGAAGLPALGIQALPGKAALLSPKGKITTAMPAYRWKKVTGATHYYLFVSGKTTPKQGVGVWYTAAEAGCASAATCTGIPETALANDTYRWWILTWNASGLGPWSAPLTFTLTAPASALNDTGIATCADNDSNWWDCPLDGYPRQDAEYGRDVTHYDDSDGYAGFSFTKLNAQGRALPADAVDWSCVRDNVTGLVWEGKTDNDSARDWDRTYTWYDARKLPQTANTETLCGFSDWRLPSPKELVGIVDYSVDSPSIVLDYFPRTVNDYYWSSLSDAGYRNGAWYVSFGRDEDYGRYQPGGSVSSNYKNTHLPVRLTRGGPSVDAFVDHQDGTVTQSNTGLMWAKCSLGQDSATCAGEPTGMTWQEALQAANDASLGGYSDWRLPNIKELQALVDYSKSRPAIDASVFPSTPGGWFWSSSSYAGYPYGAWSVDFNDGYVGNGSKANAEYVRLVRGGQ